jgi:glutamate dehydrogenase
VNIKILMDHLVKKGVVKGGEERNRILLELTDEVADLVLADNENQARAITLDSMRSVTRYEEFLSLIDDMVGAGVLNREDDAIPTRAELLASPWREKGLPRPLLAVLLGHTKMWAFQMVMETTFPESAAGEPFLEAYFPRRLRESFGAHLKEHVLRREIVATAAVNHLVNNAGITFIERLVTASKTGIGEVVAAYLQVDRAAGAPAQRERLQAKGLSAEAEHRALLEVEDALEAAARKVLEGGKGDPAEALRPVLAKIGA